MSELSTTEWGSTQAFYRGAVYAVEQRDAWWNVGRGCVSLL